MDSLQKKPKKKSENKLVILKNFLISSYYVAMQIIRPKNIIQTESYGIANLQSISNEQTESFLAYNWNSPVCHILKENNEWRTWSVSFSLVAWTPTGLATLFLIALSFSREKEVYKIWMLKS